MPIITVRVTASDLRRGLASDPLRCPVARALRRATGLRWAACRDRLVIEEPGGWDRALPASDEAEQFMRDYDNCREVGPFTFTLDVPDGWLTRE
jgi:hypothetical protein